ncbi:hypothetical protein [Streptococcus pneumoniae]|uniref:hypothetical protein n=1 Tax=Streptococcus pneumoniae TaxID=1313 RepID=UPI001D035AC2|nr:hypothetical protein [Streptococcus pneumoniae]
MKNWDFNNRKTGQGITPDLFLLQNDKNPKLFDKYACQKEKDVLQYKQVKRKGARNDYVGIRICTSCDYVLYLPFPKGQETRE